jgi:hypothetical protein
MSSGVAGSFDTAKTTASLSTSPLDPATPVRRCYGCGKANLGVNKNDEPVCRSCGRIQKEPA